MSHRWLETKGFLFGVLSFIVVSIGGLVEIVPLYMVDAQIPRIEEVKPYTPLELEGRDIYIREGCYTCHSQVVRPFRDETERYGPYSKAGEFVYDRPFQWGSKRTGPDLARLGGKYPDSWHYLHMQNPRDMAPESIMPNYPWLLTNPLDTSLTEAKLATLRKLGTPYSDEEIRNARPLLEAQASEIAERLKAADIETEADKEIIALIAYLQRLGTDIGWREQP